jgi:hypothetical protein
MRRYQRLFTPSGAFSRNKFSADYTISIFGFDFRQGQVIEQWLRSEGFLK